LTGSGGRTDGSDGRTGDHDDLFVVSPDGSTMSQITDTAEVEAFSDWGSAP
jgi:hypothetical protein